MRLCELKEKQTAVIKRLTAPAAFAERLRDMGFCEGEQAVCVRIAALRSPVLYLVKGTHIALRTADAAFVEVAP